MNQILVEVQRIGATRIDESSQEKSVDYLGKMDMDTMTYKASHNNNPAIFLKYKAQSLYKQKLSLGASLFEYKAWSLKFEFIGLKVEYYVNNSRISQIFLEYMNNKYRPYIE